jgi:uncharacterized protein (DUF934 family)
MSGVILRADGGWTAAEARVVRDPAAQPVVAGDVVPLAIYLELAPEQRKNLGVWLAPDNEPGHLAPFTHDLALIAVDFPAFKDGRGFSTATLLRTRYNFAGDLRAIGDVLIDQLFYLRRVGFSSFALRADQSRDAAAPVFTTLTDV